MNPFRAAIAAVLLAAVSATARASLATPPAPHVIAAQADVAFVGKVESVGASSMRVVVGDVLKGAPTGVVTVWPIYYPTCCPVPDEKQTPAYKVGDTVLIQAKAEKDGYETIGGATCAQPIATGEQLAPAVAFVKEMIRVARLPDDAARRAAMIAHMSSKDASYVDAATSFQYVELDTPEKSRPHVGALAAALDAPLPRGRQAAMRALVGVVPAGAVERLIELTESRDRDDADCACAALAPLDDERAVLAILDASDRKDAGVWLLHHLGASPRKEAHARMRKLLFSRDAVDRKVAFTAYVQRFQTFGATDADVDDFIEVIGKDLRATDEIYALSEPMIAAKSPRLGAAALDVVRDDASTPSMRAVAYRVLHEYATKWKMADVVASLARNEALFIRRLDGPGGDDQMHLHWILGVIRTPDCKRCLERAMKRQDTETSHGDAWRTLYDWKD